MLRSQKKRPQTGTLFFWLGVLMFASKCREQTRSLDCSHSRRRTVLARADAEVIKKALKPDDWNRYKIHCEGRRIRLYLNGQLTVDYTEPDPKIPLAGVIALQIHGGPPSEAWYREITLTELP